MGLTRVLFCGALALAATGAARAQMMLPGAAQPTPLGATPPDAAAAVARPAAAPPDPLKAALAKAPAVESIAGQQFQRNGSTGAMVFDRASPPAISRLVLTGYQVSHPSEICRVEVAGPLALTPAPRRDGLTSFNVALPACPLSLDVMDRAVRVRADVCAMAQGDCRVDTSGVWGPPGASFGDAEMKADEKTRVEADTLARGVYRRLIAMAGKDKDKVRDIAREQAAFSSIREEMCRDYAGEDKHGFCASRVTQAHAVALSYQAKPEGDEEKPKPAARKPPPAKPIAPQPVADAPATP